MKRKATIIKLTLALTLSFMANSAMAKGGYNLQQQCSTDGGTLLSNYTVKFVNATIMYHPSDDPGNGTNDAIGLKLIKDGQPAVWLNSRASMSATTESNYNSNDGLFSLIRMAYAMSVPVDACAKDGYIRGIELYDY